MQLKLKDSHKGQVASCIWSWFYMQQKAPHEKEMHYAYYYDRLTADLI